MGKTIEGHCDTFTRKEDSDCNEPELTVETKDGYIGFSYSEVKEIIDLYAQCIDSKSFSIEKLVKLNGKMNDANQVEPGIFPSVSMYLKKHKN